MNNETLFRQWLDAKIESLTRCKSINEKEGAEFLKDSIWRGANRLYDAGLAYGLAIHEKTMLENLLELKAKLDENKKKIG